MEELILLWVAEGFVQPRGAQMLEVEDLAQGYFNDLLSKFFFKQCATIQVRYKMHSLVHGMARLVSRDICFHLKHDASSCYPLFGTSCHFSLLNDSQQPLVLKGSTQNDRLRTFILMSIDPVSTEIDSKLFSHLKFLKVLGLSGAKLTVLVASISKLEYLRYLNLSGNPISHLPLSMCSLLLLQILKLRDCPNLTELPKHMSRLISLRHIDLDEESITSMPPGFGKLTQLQHLSVFVISKDIGCGIDELKELNCLRPSLHIRNIEVASASEASDAQLDMKTRLEKLELEWTSGEENSAHGEVLENLRPHVDLIELFIKNYCGTGYPSWLSDSSYHFTSIRLEGLMYCKRLPCLGELPSLTFFSVSKMPRLELIDDEFYGTNDVHEVKFPSLKCFVIEEVSELTQWQNNLGGKDMPCLEAFTLAECPLLSSLPEKLQFLLPTSHVSNCPTLQP